MQRFVILSVLFAAAFATGGSFQCNDVHFWISEGRLLEGNLQSPPDLNQDFNSELYSGLPAQQPQGASGCSSTLTFTKTSSPARHTPTAAGYTPIIGAFSLSAAGTFQYINTPNKASPIVWNGYDSFKFTATCDSTTCAERTAYVNVIFTSAALQNQARPDYINSNEFPNGIKCQGSCLSAASGMWFARQTLPRIWDTQRDERGQLVKPIVSYGGNNNIPTDGLDFEWSSNFALITTYGAIGNMAVRFPTFEVVEWQPGQQFVPSDFNGKVATTSTGFDRNCLSQQGAFNTADRGTDVWSFNTAQTDGTPASKYNSGASWYQKFGGKHSLCNIFSGQEGSVLKACKYAPLLTPRQTAIADEDTQGRWKLEVDGCVTRWQGKFTWNAMRTQTLSNGNKALEITGGGSSAFTIKGEIYNQAVQPNSWTDPSRGFVEIDHKYLLQVTLSQDTSFQFELGIDIFTVDLQQFRYFVGNEHAFGFNMIVYPKTLNSITPQSQPDRRVTGYKWVEHKWIAPSSGDCAQMACAGDAKPGRLASIAANGDFVAGENQVACTDNGADYTSNEFPGGNCGSESGPAVFLYKGPSTPTGTGVCNNGADPMTNIRDVAGISPQNPGYPTSAVTCSNNYQNITLRGRSPGSDRTKGDGAFGFEGKITLTFQLANGEHPHFVITPQMYVKSISIDGAFAGTSSTCRSSPYWPVPNPLTGIPAILCEEVDARTFGPTDWAVIFFDIKDVQQELVEMTKLSIKVNSLNIKFFPLNDNTLPGEDWNVQYTYFNFRDLKNSGQLAIPTSAAGVVPPKNTDYAFAFTPGAHNENAKITIYCTLRIKTSSQKHSARRFASSEDAPESENTVQERISIDKGMNTQLSSLSSNQRVVEGSNDASSNSSSASNSSSVTVMVLAAACAVLLAAVIGMVLYVVRQHSNNTPKRVSSTA